MEWLSTRSTISTKCHKNTVNKKTSKEQRVHFWCQIFVCQIFSKNRIFFQNIEKHCFLQKNVSKNKIKWILFIKVYYFEKEPLIEKNNEHIWIVYDTKLNKMKSIKKVKIRMNETNLMGIKLWMRIIRMENEMDNKRQ